MMVIFGIGLVISVMNLQCTEQAEEELRRSAESAATAAAAEARALRNSLIATQEVCLMPIP